MHDILRDTFHAGGSQTTQRMGACALRRATLLMSSSCPTSWPTVDSGSASRWTYVVAVDVAKRLPAQVAIDVVQHSVLRESHRYDNCSAGVVADLHPVTDGEPRFEYCHVDASSQICRRATQTLNAVHTRTMRDGEPCATSADRFRHAGLRGRALDERPEFQTRAVRATPNHSPCHGAPHLALWTYGVSAVSRRSASKATAPSAVFKRPIRGLGRSGTIVAN